MATENNIGPDLEDDQPQHPPPTSICCTLTQVFEQVSASAQAILLKPFNDF